MYYPDRALVSMHYPIEMTVEKTVGYNVYR